jgi:DnaK suppressor protein
MNTNDLIRLRTKIVAKLAELEATATNAITTIKESAAAIPSVLQDESDSAKGELDLENAMRVHRHSTEQRRHLHNAIIRMESGAYGVCLECGDEIAMRRLEAVPGARLCLHCQAEREYGMIPEAPCTKNLKHTQIRQAA